MRKMGEKIKGPKKWLMRIHILDCVEHIGLQSKTLSVLWVLLYNKNIVE